MVGGHKWYWMKMPMVQGDTEIQIALFQLFDRGSAPVFTE